VARSGSNAVVVVVGRWVLFANIKMLRRAPPSQATPCVWWGGVSVCVVCVVMFVSSKANRRPLLYGSNLVDPASNICLS